MRVRIILPGMVAGGLFLGLLNPSWDDIEKDKIEAREQLVRTELVHMRDKACDTTIYLDDKQMFSYPEIEWVRRELNPQKFLTSFENKAVAYAADHPTSLIGTLFSPGDYEGAITLTDVTLGLPYPKEVYDQFLEDSKGQTSIATDLPSVSRLRNGFSQFCNYLSSKDVLKAAYTSYAKNRNDGDRIRNGIAGAGIGAILGMIGYLCIRRGKKTA